jgi:hypothetical protein
VRIEVDAIENAIQIVVMNVLDLEIYLNHLDHLVGEVFVLQDFLAAMTFVFRSETPAADLDLVDLELLAAKAKAAADLELFAAKAKAAVQMEAVVSLYLVLPFV